MPLIFDDLYEGEGDDTIYKYWDFVGEVIADNVLKEYFGPNALDYVNKDENQYLIWMRVAAAFLRQTYGKPPDGSVLGILWTNAPHGEGKFPFIGVGSESESASYSPEIEEYKKRLKEGLLLFDKAIDWKNIPRSKIES